MELINCHTSRLLENDNREEEEQKKKEEEEDVQSKVMMINSHQ